MDGCVENFLRGSKMDEQEYLKLFISISKDLGEINSKLEPLSKILEKHDQAITAHESRLTRLEVSGNGLKSDVLSLAVKGLVISICALGTLAGAGTIIAKAIGM